MNVDFWTFRKRQNSTAQPGTNPAVTLACVLKDNSGVLHPVLEIYQSAVWNPSAYNYARISAYDRYYYVADWQWIVGRWECTLNSDPLASFKTQIGAATKYILRSSNTYNNMIVDTLYPALAREPVYYYDTADFAFDRDFDGGMYVVGIANRESESAGAITYYTLTSAQVKALVRYMLVTVTDAWTQGFTGLTDVLYRSIYSPFDYIKSCKWYPMTYFSLDSVNIMFGNYESDVVGQVLSLNTALWPTDTRTLTLPTTWLTQDAKYRVSPYAHLYLVFNPWGIIELNPLDFSNSNTIRLRIFPDYISGDCMLKVYKVVGGTEYFITQSNAKISVDINLSASSVDIGNLLKGTAGVVAGVAAIATGGASAIAGGVLSAAGGALDVAQGATPSMSNSSGQQFGGARAMEGVATLIYTSTYFTNEDNDEFGKPLMMTRTISTIPGYIKCGDSEISLNCYPEERDIIENYLTEGFHYE